MNKIALYIKQRTEIRNEILKLRLESIKISRKIQEYNNEMRDMSSTGRTGDRKDQDYYITPIVEIEKFLIEFNRIIPLMGQAVLDPSAGGDGDHPMSYPTALEPYGCDIVTMDIREDSLAQQKGDYLKKQFITPEPTVIMTNPPFRLAIEFIKKALKDVRPGGHVAMLCRLNFFGSQKRKAFWNGNMPVYTFVHNKRMSFTADGKTDSIEYAHLVWQRGVNPEYTRLKVI
ncbi:MAG: hypothetical protein Q8N08_07760 [Methanobacteriaceae archaeon]|nr:hypothetical protein [Methanobacteriaceae archaeon]